MHITVLCLSTSLQRTAIFDGFAVNEVNRSRRFRLDASGKGLNSARVLHQLEKKSVTAIAPIGKENADVFLSLVKDDLLPIEPVFLPGFTRECLTIVDKLGKTTTELVMDEPLFSQEIIDTDIAQAEKEIDEKLEKLFKNSDAFVFTGSRPQYWSKDLPAKVCKKALERGLTVLVDCQGVELLNILEVCTPTIIKINEKEFCSTFTVSENLSQNCLLPFVTKKSEELQNIVIVTRGKQPGLIGNKGDSALFETQKVDVVNTIGCGDSFNAGFLHEYIRGIEECGEPNLLHSCKNGVRCASLNAANEKVGNIK